MLGQHRKPMAKLLQPHSCSAVHFQGDGLPPFDPYPEQALKRMQMSAYLREAEIWTTDPALGLSLQVFLSERECHADLD